MPDLFGCETKDFVAQFEKKHSIRDLGSPYNLKY